MYFPLLSYYDIEASISWINFVLSIKILFTFILTVYIRDKNIFLQPHKKKNFEKNFKIFYFNPQKKMKLLIISILILVIQITVNNAYNCVQDPVVKPSIAMPGSFTPIAVDSTVTSVALDSTYQFNALYNTASYYYKLICIKSAKSQVVAGLKYRINATISETTCQKNTILSKPFTPNVLSNCAVPSKPILYNCLFTYLSQPWLNVNKLIEYPQCVNVKN